MMSKANKTLPVVSVVGFDSLKIVRHDPNNMKTFTQTVEYSLNSRGLVEDGFVAGTFLNRDQVMSFAVGKAMFVFCSLAAVILGAVYLRVAITRRFRRLGRALAYIFTNKSRPITLEKTMGVQQLALRDFVAGQCRNL